MDVIELWDIIADFEEREAKAYRGTDPILREARENERYKAYEKVFFTFIFGGRA